MSTGIVGMDELSEGGLPSGTVSLVCGPPGSAKSLFAMQFICGGARKGEKGAILTLEESRVELLRSAKRYHMGLGELEKEGMVRILDMGALNAARPIEKRAEGLIGFEGLLDTALHLHKNMGITRLAVDSLSALGLYYQAPDVFRRELFRCCRKLKSVGLTTVVISEAQKGMDIEHSIEHFISDSVIQLGYENVKGEYRRTIRIYKMRFTRHDPYKHPFLITPNGIEIDASEVIF